MENIKKKYPRSYHLNYSQKSSADDKRHESDAHFIGKDIVVTLKMDGENSTVYNNTIHARSLDSGTDTEDRKWLDALRISKIEGNMPDSYRICGENLFYKHTVAYDNLESMFYAFSIWDGDTCLSWEETKLWCGMLGISIVPVIYEGVYNKNLILDEFKKYKGSEGFVIRLKDEFDIKDFKESLSKYVSDSFVLPSNHWRYSTKTLNKLKSGKSPWEII